ncbi:MAG: nuclear transport factor 2 family protein [Pseudomonadota bacterium]
MQDIAAFLRDCETVWNGHDLNRIMSQFRDDIVCQSRKAVPLSGDGVLGGHDALHASSAVALKRQPDLTFEVSTAEEHEMVLNSYRNHRNVLATGTLYFEAEGKVSHATACDCVADGGVK